MPDQATESGGLEQTLLNLADKASGRAEGSKGSSFPAYIVFSILAVICFSVLGFLAVRAKRRVAQLEYEIRQKNEEQKRMEEKAKLEADRDKRNAAILLAHDLAEGIDGLKKELAAHEASSAARAKALAKATSWDDLVIVDKRK